MMRVTQLPGPGHHSAPQIRSRWWRLAALGILAAVPGFADDPPLHPPAVPSGAIEIAPDEPPVGPGEFFSRYGITLGLGPTDRMESLARYESGTPGLSIERFVQYSGKAVVLGSDYTLVVREDGTVQTGVGLIVPGIHAGAAATTAASALVMAKKEFQSHYGLTAGIVTYDERTACTLAYSPFGETWVGSSYELVYFCPAIASEPRASLVVEVDALSGTVRRSYRLLDEQQPTPGEWSAASADGWTLHHANRAFAAQRDALTGRHRLETEFLRTWDNRADPNQGWTVASGIDFLDADQSFDEPSQEPGVSAHWALLEAARFFETRHRVSCFKGGLGDFPVLESFIGTMPESAVFDPHMAHFFFGDPPQGLGPLISLDLAGHEFGHCVDRQSKPTPATAQAARYGEAAAIGEGSADIAGVLLERDVLGETDWRIGTPEWPSAGRSLEDPPSSPRPGSDRYRDHRWQSTAADARRGSAHRNGGVLGKWFFLLAADDQKGVGEELASDLWALSLLKKATPTYPAARAAARHTAAEMCGERSILAAANHDAWHAVRLNTAPYVDSAITIPEPGALNVEPWPVKLAWPAHGRFTAESAWKVAIAKSANLLTDLILLDSAEVGNQPGIGRVGVVSVALEPDTDYFWSVRPAASLLDPACWRPVRAFRTDSKTPDALAPITGKGDSETHPWDMPFEWTEVDNATGYEIEISQQEDFAELIYPRVRFDAAAVGLRQRPKLHGLVKTPHFWRVRATFLMEGQEEPQTVAGPWSRTARFRTTKPRVQVIQPADQESVFPWPVEFSWSFIRGADHFLLETREHTSSNDWTEGVTRQPPVDGAETSLDVNFAGDVVGNQPYDWRLRVIGPTPAGAGPPFPEEGTPDRERFEISSLATKVEAIAPDRDQCPKVGQPMRFQFTGVEQATGYKVRAYEVKCRLASGSSTEVECWDGDAMAPILVEAEGSIEVEAEVRGVVARPQSSYVAGYSWQVQAVGPEDLPGSYFQSGPMPSFPWYFLQPPPPKLMSPADGAALSAKDKVEFVWTTTLAHGDGFVATVYDGGNCDPDRVLRSDVIPGFSPGTTTAHWGGHAGNEHSWRVRPFVFNPMPGEPNPCAINQWSECRSFRLTKEPTEPPDDVDKMACPATAEQGGNVEENHYISVGASEGTFRLSYDHFDVPDNLFVYHDDNVIWSSHCVGGAAEVDIPFSGANDWVRVQVEPNCAGDPDTIWNFRVECAQ